MNAEKTLSRYFSPLLGKKNGKARTAQDDSASEQKIETVEKMLEVLRTLLNNDFIEIEERRNLWNVLTALRGPDDQDDTVKLACVSQIRRAVAGQSFADFGAYHRFDSEEDANIRSKMETSHFKLHMHAAFEAGPSLVRSEPPQK